MSTLNFDPATSALSLAAPLTIIAGYDQPFRVVLASSATISDIQLALVGTAGARPTLAYTEDFAPENATNFLAMMDCNDVRLLAALEISETAALALQFAALVNGARVSAKVSVTVQLGALGGEQTSQGGPVFDTVPQRNTAIAAAVAAGVASVPAQPAAVSQAEAEAGVQAAARTFSPLRVRQAILTAPIAATQLTGTIDIARLPAGGGGSTPNLAAVLAAGADGGAVDIANLGHMELAAGKEIGFPNDAGVPMDTTTPVNWIRVRIGGSTYEIPAYQ